MYRVFFFTGPAQKVLSMELVPPNKEIDWFRIKVLSMGLVPPRFVSGPMLKERSRWKRGSRGLTCTDLSML